MNSIPFTFASLFLRGALVVSFLSAVADRLGWWGKPGTPGVSWGNWENFVSYSNSINFYVSPAIGEILALSATAVEVLLAILLLIGYRTKWAAIGSGILLVTFAFTMTLSFGFKPAFDYSVWTAAAACLLLSCMPSYPFSLDHYLTNKK